LSAVGRGIKGGTWQWGLCWSIQ